MIYAIIVSYVNSRFLYSISSRDCSDRGTSCVPRPRDNLSTGDAHKKKNALAEILSKSH